MKSWLNRGTVSTTVGFAAALDQDYEVVPVDRIRPHPENPRHGNLEAIRESIRTNGFYGACLVQRSTGHILVGNHRYIAATEEGLLEVPVVWADVDDATARRIMLADNRTTDLATYDDSILIDLLTAVAHNDDLVGSGYTAADLELLTEAIMADSALAALVDAPIPQAGSLTHDVALFFNASPFLGKLGETMGWRAGAISSAVSPRFLAQCETLPLDVGFVDNEFKEYDHESHVAAVKALSPDFATVRDVMTEAQCAQADIDYYPLGQVLEMAQEVDECATNTILIPKYDCLDDIPDQFILGYSVPTSYGMTPLPLEAFQGRRVHLLGGNWDRQLRAVGVLSSDVVSIDNNHMLMKAEFGTAYAMGGAMLQVADVVDARIGSYGMLPALVLSMGSVVTDLYRMGCWVNGAAPRPGQMPLGENGA
jgi:hypothetical protein